MTTTQRIPQHDFSIRPNLKTFTSIGRETLRVICPPVFATHEHPYITDLRARGMSGYQFFPVLPAMEKIEACGGICTGARTIHVRSKADAPYARFELDFSWREDVRSVSKPFFRFTLGGSHDRSTEIYTSAGIHTLSCSNGATMRLFSLGESRIKHDNTLSNEDIILRIVNALSVKRQTMEWVERAMVTRLTRDQQLSMGERFRIEMIAPDIQPYISASDIIAPMFEAELPDSDGSRSVMATMNSFDSRFHQHGGFVVPSNGAKKSYRRLRPRTDLTTMARDDQRMFAVADQVLREIESPSQTWELDTTNNRIFTDLPALH